MIYLLCSDFEAKEISDQIGISWNKHPDVMKIQLITYNKEAAELIAETRFWRIIEIDDKPFSVKLQ